MDNLDRAMLCPLSMAAETAKPCDYRCRLYARDGECLLAAALKAVTDDDSDDCGWCDADDSCKWI